MTWAAAQRPARNVGAALPLPGRALGLVVLLCTCIVNAGLDHRVPDPSVGPLSTGRVGAGAPLGAEGAGRFPLTAHSDARGNPLDLAHRAGQEDGWGRLLAGRAWPVGAVRGGEGSDAESSVVEDEVEEDYADDDQDVDDGVESAFENGGVVDVHTDSLESFEDISDEGEDEDGTDLDGEDDSDQDTGGGGDKSEGETGADYGEDGQELDSCEGGAGGEWASGREAERDSAAESGASWAPPALAGRADPAGCAADTAAAWEAARAAAEPDGRGSCSAWPPHTAEGPYGAGWAPAHDPAPTPEYGGVRFNNPPCVRPPRGPAAVRAGCSSGLRAGDGGGSTQRFGK
jgi:hypothetical protein